jgi:hypothetical protein
MSRLLAIGAKGKDLFVFQQLMNHYLCQLSIPIDTDGDFDTNARQRVIDFQTLNRKYPVVMPLQDDGEPLDIDGIVGPQTLCVLLDVLSLYGTSQLAPLDNAVDSKTIAVSALRSPQFLADVTPVSDPQPQPPTPSKTVRFVELQAGSQGTVNPWSFSPF